PGRGSLRRVRLLGPGQARRLALSVQVLVDRSYQVPGAPFARWEVELTYQRRRYSRRLSHAEVRSPGDLVGYCHLGQLERACGPVGGALEVEDGGHPRDADGDMRETAPPGASEGVGDDHGEGGLELALEADPDAVRGAVRILREQDHRARLRVGPVDARVGA